MNRRFFLRSVGLAAGAISISDRFLLRAERYFERHDEPLLKQYRKAWDTVYAHKDGNLYLGDPCEGPTDIPTWREWFRDFQGLTGEELTPEYIGDEHGIYENLDTQMDKEYYRDFYWDYHESPNARAFDYFDNARIGPDLLDENNEVVGSLEFMDGVCPGNDTRLVMISEEAALSCLQYRMEKLGTPVNIKQFDW